MTNKDDNLMALDKQICFALTVASRSVVSAYRDVLAPLGITHPQYLVLLALWENEPLSLSKLSALLRQEAGTLSPLVKRLEHQGLLTRSRLPNDERTLSIALTERGREMRNEASDIPTQMAERLGMSHKEIADLHASMMRLIEHTANYESQAKAAAK